jgi:hypothetical protein
MRRRVVRVITISPRFKTWLSGDQYELSVGSLEAFVERVGGVMFLLLLLALVPVLFNICWWGVFGLRRSQNRRPPGFMTWISSKVGSLRGVNPRRPEGDHDLLHGMSVRTVMFWAERRRYTILKGRVELGEVSVTLVRIRKDWEGSKRRNGGAPHSCCCL